MLKTFSLKRESIYSVILGGTNKHYGKKPTEQNYIHFVLHHPVLAPFLPLYSTCWLPQHLRIQKKGTLQTFI